MKSRIHLLIAATATLSVRLGMATAAAGTVPYTEALLSTFNPTESVTPIVTHSSPAIGSTLSYQQSGDWGRVSGFASADLATGQLKVLAANAPLAGYSPYMQSNAWFGDGFRASRPDGSLFAWLPGSAARFSLDLTDNSVSTSGAQLGDIGYGQVGGFVLLSIFQHDTLDPSSKLVGGSNNMRYFLYLLGNPNQNLLYTDQDGQSHALVPTATYNDLSGNIHITQDFQPQGDFDWVVLLGAAGQVTGPEFYSMDFSHSLTVGYQGPAGSTTTSVSGLFTNFQVVPEPTAWLLLASGGVAVLGYRRFSAARQD